MDMLTPSTLYAAALIAILAALWGLAACWLLCLI